MSVLDNRVFQKSSGWYGKNERPALGISSSAIVISDDGEIRAYFGTEKHVEIVDPETGLDGEGQPYELPLDFRKIGIQLMTAYGVSADVQATMFARFVQYDATQRAAIIAEFEGIDPSDTNAVHAFINNMVALLGE